MTRKTKLVDCNPRWVSNFHGGDVIDAVRFDCPEGHADCIHVIPFTPALDGSTPARQGALWQRSGGTFEFPAFAGARAFETLTLTPSIKRNPLHADRAAALAAGCLEEHLTDSMFCAFHGFVTKGEITFCGDSK